MRRLFYYRFRWCKGNTCFLISKLFLKIFLDNFKIYVKLVKLLGDQVFNNRFKSRYIKNNLGSYIYRKKKKLKIHQFFKWDRLLNLYIKMSSMGSYYYWFSHINKWHYYICYYKYFFNSIYKTFYIKYFILFYLILCFVIYKKYCKYNDKLYNIKYKFTGLLYNLSNDNILFKMYNYKKNFIIYQGFLNHNYESSF